MKKIQYLLLFVVSMVVIFLPMYVFALTWTEQTNSGSRDWYGMASSSDGVKLAAIVNNGYIFTSTDSGANWTQRTGSGSRNWYSITSSADGTKLAALVSGGYIYTSTDSGVNWTEQTGAGSRNWATIASSSDGAKLVAINSPGYIYTSTDSGANWIQQTGSGSLAWSSVASSTDGVKLVASVGGGYIYTSTDSGVNWTQRTSSGSLSWSVVASSSDGIKLVAVVGGGNIYTSTDSGVNWTDRSNAGYWYTLASSSDGTKLLTGGSGNYLMFSTDSGANWVQQTSAGARDWYGSGMSSDGTKLAASHLGGYIYASDNSDSTPPTITNVSSDKANGSYTVGEVIDIDVTFSEAVTSTGNVTVTLETGATDRTCTFTVSSSTTGTCNYTVQSGDESSDLTVSTISGTIADAASNSISNFVPTTNLAANKALVIDAIAPTISEVTAIGTSLDTTPAYTFTTNEVGTISYGGSCSSVTTSATLGNNTINFSLLPLGTYSNCTIIVTDATGNASNTLTVSSFSVNAQGSVPVWILQAMSDRESQTNLNPTVSCTEQTAYSPTTGSKCPTVVTNQPNVSTCPRLPTTPKLLKLNMVHPTIKVLQQVLNCKGYSLANTGPGSSGNETNKFGLLTKKALIKFQKENSLTPDGVVGEETRRVVE